MRIKKIKQNTRDFNITDAVTDGGTDLNKNTFNGMQDNIEEAVNDIGSIVITSTNTNPSSKLGGTWELISKGWKEGYITEENMEGILFEKNSNVSSYDIFAVRSADYLRIRLTIVTAVAIGEDKIELGKLNPTQFGTETFIYSFSHISCFTDNGNGIIDARVSLDGTVTTEDFISKTGANSISANCSFAIDIGIVKIDSACNRFYWKRTA